MHKAALLYSSTTGTTAKVAREIARQLEGIVHEVLDVANVGAEHVQSFDALILGIPTYGEERLPDAWVSFFDELGEHGLRGKLVAVFGLGNQAEYPDRFQDAMGLLFDRLKELGAQFIGAWSTDGYAFDRSKAVDRGSFVGLAIDADTQNLQTDARIRRWASQIRLALEERCAEPLPHTLG
jgi:flavodoxin I